MPVKMLGLVLFIGVFTFVLQISGSIASSLTKSTFENSSWESRISEIGK